METGTSHSANYKSWDLYFTPPYLLIYLCVPKCIIFHLVQSFLLISSSFLSFLYSFSFFCPVMVFRHISSLVSLLWSSLVTHLYSLTPSANVKSLSSRQAHVVSSFQPMNKLSKRGCLAPWKTLVPGPRWTIHGRAHTIVCFFVQPVLRFQGSVLSRSVLYIWTELGPVWYLWLDLTQTHKQLKPICGGRE